MIRYYTVAADLKTGYDIDYSFNHLKDAEAKYESLTEANVTFKSITASDDQTGELILKSETY